VASRKKKKREASREKTKGIYTGRGIGKKDPVKCKKKNSFTKRSQPPPPGLSSRENIFLLQESGRKKKWGSAALENVPFLGKKKSRPKAKKGSGRRSLLLECYVSHRILDG